MQMHKFTTMATLAAGLSIFGAAAHSAPISYQGGDPTLGTSYTLDYTVSDTYDATYTNPGIYTGTGAYLYNYTVTLVNPSPQSLDINVLGLSNVSGYIAGTASATGAFDTASFSTLVSEANSDTSSPSDFSGNVASITFTADPTDPTAPGLIGNGATTTLSFYSVYDITDFAVNPSADALGGQGGIDATNPLPGPGVATPEPGSLTILGLGALALGLMARRARRA
jgi:hypothetical protein